MNSLQKSSTLSFSDKKFMPKLIILCALLIFSAFLGIACGSSSLNIFDTLKEIFRGERSSPEVRILLHVRLPRVCAALLSGAALSVSGILLQAVLSNPLAAPNVIGVNSGAGLFTFIAIALFPASTAAAPVGAFFGALLATLIVYLISLLSGSGTLTIILAGVAVSSIFTAGINTIKTFFPDTIYNGSSFMIGGFSGVSMKNLSPAWLMILAALFCAFCLFHQTDLLCLGTETAQSLGMNVKSIRFTLIVIACVLAGAAVSFSGLIGFVGLIVPHIARRLFGTGHKRLIPAGCLLGAILVTLCDLLSRILFAPYELPVGILLSLIGGPFFILLIVKRRGRKKAVPYA